jgi:hypothetical protein
MSRGRTANVAAALSLVLLAGCGAASTPPSATPRVAKSAASPSPSPSPSATPSPSPTSAGPYIVTWDGGAVSLLTTDGSVVAKAPAVQPWPTIESDVVIGRSGVYFLNGTTIADARIERLQPDGTVTTVGTLPPIPPSVDGNQPDFSVDVSPDGSQIVVGSLVAVSSVVNQVTYEPETYTSELWLSTNGSTPVSVLKQTGTFGSLLPFAWTPAQGIYAADLPWGIGGAGPYLDYTAFGAVRIDPSTWGVTSNGTCALSDSGAVDALTGNTVCLSGGTGSGLFAVTVSGKTTKVQTVGHPYVGTFRIDDSGTQFAFAFCDGTYGVKVSCGVSMVDVATGQTTTAMTGPVSADSDSGRLPNVVGWLPSGDLLITDTAGVESVSPDGTLQLLIPDPTLPVVGILG